MCFDTFTVLASAASAGIAGFGIGYKLCPKTVPAPTVTHIKRECKTYKKAYPGRKGNRRFEVVLRDSVPSTCNCPELKGSKCALTQKRCRLLK